MLVLMWLRGAVGRRLGRTLAEAAGIAVTVALLASLGIFLATSKRTMTTRAAAHVAVDWQVQLQPGADEAHVLDAVHQETGVLAAVPVEFARTSALTAVTGASTQTTGAGVVVGIPDGYQATFPDAMRSLLGASDGVLLAQQTAATLHATVGGTVRIGRDGLPDASVVVAGIVELPQADSFFQTVGAPSASQPVAPPDNVLLLPASQWHQLFDPLAATNPDALHTQVHAELDRSFPGDPSAAFVDVTGRAHHLEALLSGGGIVGDNLGASLDAARKDALYAQVLFLFLGLPGAILAILIAGSIASNGNERRRAEQAILRARGATTSTLVRLAAAEALAIGIAGAAVGVLAGHIVAGVVGDASLGVFDRSTRTWAGGAAAVGLLVALATIAAPAWRDARRLTVTQARRRLPGFGRRRPRLVLAVMLLALSTAVFAKTSNDGYSLVLVAEGVPSISVSYWAFLGPALFWVGAALLVLEIAVLGLDRGRRVGATIMRPFAGSLAPTFAASMQRQRPRLARGLVVVCLTVAFAVSTSTFNETYRQQAAVDALLTNGADVTVSSSSSLGFAHDLTSAITATPGVRHVEPLQHRFAYVGADLQDLFGVRTSTIVDATRLQDAYFAGGSAHDLVAQLATSPDGLLVSLETVNDFQLLPGDPITLRLQAKSGGTPTPVTFHYLGVAKEFPTAPRDSFLIANADYVARATGNAAVDTYLVDVQGAAPSGVADQLRTQTHGAAVVTDITSARHIAGSSLTAVDLAGLTRIELAFAGLLIVAASGLVLVLGVAERRRTFAIASALGANRRQIGGFVWTEAIFVTIGGVVAGALVGWILTLMLIAVLSGVFDPAPEHASIPWAYLGAVLATAAAAVVVGSALSVRLARAANVAALRTR